MSLMETKDELTTEITSEVDVLVDVFPTGIGVSVFIDDEHFTDEVEWEDIARSLINDRADNIYDDDELDDILFGFKYVIDEVKNARGK